MRNNNNPYDEDAVEEAYEIAKIALADLDDLRGHFGLTGDEQQAVENSFNNIAQLRDDLAYREAVAGTDWDEITHQFSQILKFVENIEKELPDEAGTTGIEEVDRMAESASFIKNHSIERRDMANDLNDR